RDTSQPPSRASCCESRQSAARTQTARAKPRAATPSGRSAVRAPATDPCSLDHGSPADLTRAEATARAPDLYYPRMIRAAVVLGVCALVGASRVRAQEPSAPSMRGETLYRMTLLRAAPGRLLDLVAAVKGHGLVLRHSQGDQWDLMVLSPVAGYADLAGAA